MLCLFKYGIEFPLIKPTLRAARASIRKHDFERFFNGYHIQIYANSYEELSEENITASLQACAGAHKPQAYQFS